jgi:hypothetical protein
VDAAICHQKSIKYTRPSQACGDLPGATVGVTGSGVEWPCLNRNLSPGTVLAYDQSISEWGFTCLIDYDAGVKCSNQNNDGFTMNYTGGVSTF